MLMAVGVAACNPGTSVYVTNKTNAAWILAWFDAQHDYRDPVTLPPAVEGFAYAEVEGSVIGTGSINDWTFMVLTPDCKIASVTRESGGVINLEVKDPDGDLVRVDKSNVGGSSVGPSRPADLEHTDECLSP